jgi:hypothetical protein
MLVTQNDNGYFGHQIPGPDVKTRVFALIVVIEEKAYGNDCK